jgi:hypothetical protein
MGKGTYDQHRIKKLDQPQKLKCKLKIRKTTTLCQSLDQK